MPDPAIRRAAFEWLSTQVEVHGDVLPWALLQRGFTFRGERVPRSPDLRPDSELLAARWERFRGAGAA